MSKHYFSEAQHANKEHYTDIKHKETIMASNTRWRRNRSATEHKHMMTPTTMMEAGNIQTTKMLMSTWTWNPKRLLVTIVQPKQAQTSMANRASSKHVTSEIRRQPAIFALPSKQRTVAPSGLRWGRTPTACRSTSMPLNGTSCASNRPWTTTAPHLNSTPPKRHGTQATSGAHRMDASPAQPLVVSSAPAWP